MPQNDNLNGSKKSEQKYVVVDVVSRDSYLWGGMISFMSAFLMLIVGATKFNIDPLLGAIRAIEMAVFIGGLAAFLVGALSRRSFKGAKWDFVRGLLGAILPTLLLFSMVGLGVASRRDDANQIGAIPQAVFNNMDTSHDGRVSLAELKAWDDATAQYVANQAAFAQALDSLKPVALKTSSINSEDLKQAQTILQKLQSEAAKDIPKVSDAETNDRALVEREFSLISTSVCGAKSENDANASCTLAQLRSYPAVVRAKYGSYYWLADMIDHIFK